VLVDIRMNPDLVCDESILDDCLERLSE